MRRDSEESTRLSDTMFTLHPKLRLEAQALHLVQTAAVNPENKPQFLAEFSGTLEITAMRLGHLLLSVPCLQSRVPQVMFVSNLYSSPN